MDLKNIDGTTPTTKRVNLLFVISQIPQIIKESFIDFKDLIQKLYRYQKMGVLFMPIGKKFTLLRDAEFSNLKELREFLVKYCKRAGMNPKKTGNAQLVLDEIATNIIRHAYKDIERSYLSISITRHSTHVEVVIEDEGVEFDWNTVLDPDLKKYVENKRKGGLGIMLIRKLTDDRKYERIGKVNRVSLTFNLEKNIKESALSNLTEQLKQQFSITARFGVVVAFALTLILTVSYLIFSNATSGMAKKNLFSKGRDAAVQLAGSSGLYLIDDDQITLNEYVQSVINEIEGIDYVTVVDTNGMVIASDKPEELFNFYVFPGTVRSVGSKVTNTTYHRIVKANGDVVYDVEVPIVYAEIWLGTLHLGLAKNTLDLVEAEAEAKRKSLFIMLFVWGISMLLVVVLMSTFIKPIKIFTEALSQIGNDDFDIGKLKAEQLKEFKEVSLAIENMTSRIAEQESQLTDQTRIHREMQLAKDIQDAILPSKAPVIDGFEFDGRYRSAVEMGGDYYDYFPVGKDKFGLAVGDVSGKGIGAAFIMSIARMAIRSEAKNISRASDVLVKVDNLINSDIKKGMYITVFYLVLDQIKRTVSYASAGHNPMILFRAKEKKTYFLNPKGVAIGLKLPPGFFKEQLTSEFIQLQRNDLLFVYTDGITEAMNHDRKEYGDKRLVDFIVKNNELIIKDFCDKLDQDISDFVQDYPQSDDITYLVIRAKANEAELRYDNIKKALSELENNSKLEENAKSRAEILTECGFTEDEFKKIETTIKKSGIEAFLPVEEGEEEKEVGHASLDETRKILSIVRQNPEWGTKRIQTELNTERYGFEEISLHVINKELKKQKIGSKAARIRFSTREVSSINVYKE